MSWILYKDLVLDTVKSATVLGTDSNGTVISGVTGADARYLKLDQTTPQTVSGGEVTFTNSSTFTIGNVASGTATQVAGSSFYYGGYTYEFTVYAYKTAGSGRVYSAMGKLISLSDAESPDPFDISLSWGAVAGAEGYRVIITYDDYTGWYGSGYIDTATNSLTYTGSSVVSGSTVTPSSPATVFLGVLDINGNVDVEGETTLVGTLGVTGRVSFEDSGSSSALRVTGYGDGGYATYNIIEAIDVGTGNSMALMGAAPGGVNGYLAMIGHVTAANSYVCETAYLNAHSSLADKRIALLQAVSDANADQGQLAIFTSSGSGLNANALFKANGRVVMKEGGVSAYSVAPSSTLSIGGNLVVGATSYLTTAAPTNGILADGDIKTSGSMIAPEYNIISYDDESIFYEGDAVCLV